MVVILCAGWFWDFAKQPFGLRMGGVEIDAFDFLIFFAKKSKNQKHLSPKVFFPKSQNHLMRSIVG
jgi:hypothetical protein